jgi:hypothetical protein
MLILLLVTHVNWERRNSVALLALGLIGGCCQSLFIAATLASDPSQAWDESSQDRPPNKKESHRRKCEFEVLSRCERWGCQQGRIDTLEVRRSYLISLALNLQLPRPDTG